MPILSVEIVVRPGEVVSPDLPGRIADAAAAVFAARPGATWVKLTPLAAQQYAEDDGGPPAGVYPVFISVLKYQRPQGEQLAREARALAEAVARVCDRPVENVHILYEPDARGRIAFGGQLRD